MSEEPTHTAISPASAIMPTSTLSPATVRSTRGVSRIEIRSRITRPLRECPVNGVRIISSVIGR